MLILKLLLLVLVLGTFLAVWRMESKWRIVVTPFLLIAYFEFVRVLPPFFLADVYGETSSVGPVLVATAAYCSVIFGFVLAYFHRPTGRKNVLSLSESAVPKLGSTPGEAGGVVFVVVILVASGLVMFGGLPPVAHAITGFLSGGGGEVATYVSDQRFLLTKSAYFGGEYRAQGLISSLQRIGWSMVVCYALLKWFDDRSMRRAVVLGLSVVGAWLFVAGDGTRGDLLNLLIFAAGVYSLRRAFRPRTVVIIFVAGLGAGILLSLYSNKMYNDLTMSDGGFVMNAIGELLARLFLGNGMNDVRIVDMVNSGALELRWGATHFRDMISALPGIEYGVPLSFELYQIMNPLTRSTAFYSGTYISDAYIDFGWMGVVPIFMLSGMVIGFFQRILFKVRPMYWTVAFWAVLAFSSVTILRSGFVGLASQLVIIALLFLCHRMGVFVTRAASVRKRSSHAARGMRLRRRGGAPQ